MLISFGLVNQFSDGVIFRHKFGGSALEGFMDSLKLVINSCAFSFLVKCYKQQEEKAISSPDSPVIANVYVEYFKKTVLQFLNPVPSLMLIIAALN